MKTIVFYGYKGGTGRTLALANVATQLAQVGFRVGAIDFDLEAPGLHYKLLPGADEANLPLGLIDYIVHVFQNRAAPNSLSEYGTELQISETGSVWVLPAGKSPTPAYWGQVASLNWTFLATGEPSPLLQMCLELKAQIESERRLDYLLIDARTGLTDTNGVALRALADHIVAMAVPTPEHVNGLLSVLRPLSLVTEPHPIEITLVLSRTPSEAKLQSRAVSGAIRALLALDDGLPHPLKSPIELRSDAQLDSGEFLHLENWGTNHSRDSLTHDYLELLSRIAPDYRSKLTGALEQRVQAIWQRLQDSGTPKIAERELRALLHLYPGAVTADGLVRLLRIQLRLDLAFDVLAGLDDADLVRSAQLEATIAGSPNQLQPQFVERLRGIDALKHLVRDPPSLGDRQSSGPLP